MKSDIRVRENVKQIIERAERWGAPVTAVSMTLLKAILEQAERPHD